MGLGRGTTRLLDRASGEGLNLSKTCDLVLIRGTQSGVLDSVHIDVVSICEVEKDVLNGEGRVGRLVVKEGEWWTAGVPPWPFLPPFRVVCTCRMRGVVELMAPRVCGTGSSEDLFGSTRRLGQSRGGGCVSRTSTPKLLCRNTQPILTKANTKNSRHKHSKQGRNAHTCASGRIAPCCHSPTAEGQRYQPQRRSVCFVSQGVACAMSRLLAGHSILLVGSPVAACSSSAENLVVNCIGRG